MSRKVPASLLVIGDTVTVGLTHGTVLRAPAPKDGVIALAYRDAWGRVIVKDVPKGASVTILASGLDRRRK